MWQCHGVHISIVSISYPLQTGGLSVAPDRGFVIRLDKENPDLQYSGSFGDHMKSL